MKKYAVFSNYGPWDTDRVGFIMFADLDETQTPEEQLRSLIPALHADIQAGQHVEIESVLVITTENKQQMPESYWEMSLYCKPDFVLEGLAKFEEHWDMYIGLIEVV